MRGSEHNDPIISPDGTTGDEQCRRNRGRAYERQPGRRPRGDQADGQHLVAAITLNTESGKPEELRIKGRHDACIALRAPVVVEAAAAVALCDLTLIARSLRP